MITYSGLIAPEETLTGDGRMFAAGKGRWRDNIPVMFKDKSGGHGDAVVVGTLRGQTRLGPGGVWGTVEFMDPKLVPEVVRATYMLDQKAVGPSVDLSPEYTVEAVPHPTRPDKKVARFTDYMVVGVTLVPMPAFSEVHLTCDQEGERALLAGAGVDLNHVTFFDINMNGWDRWPLAMREYPYNADQAVKRIADWSGIGTPRADVNKYASTFLWRDGNQTADSMVQDSFRMPLADIIDGQPHLVYHAVYAAAALLSGGHGGIPRIPPEDQETMKGVITNIYAKMAEAYGDSGMKSPFDPSYTNRRKESQPGMAMEQTTDGRWVYVTNTGTTAGNVSVTHDFAGASEPYGDVTYADPGYRDNQKRYPIDTPEHVRAAWSYINQEKNAAFYDAQQLAAIKAKIKAAAKRMGIDIAEQEGMALLAGIGVVRPPRSAFNNPKLTGKTKLTVTEDGRVFGHVAPWKQCHVGVGDACIIAPHSRTDYAYFRQGPVICDDGSKVYCGKITVGTGHADAKWGIMPSREHYDNTAWCAAVVNVGEDRHGIWVAGVLVPSASDEMVATLRLSQLSGDWRWVNGNHEMIAALVVNNPGFPVVQYKDGDVFSMQGVGVIEESEVDAPFFGIEAPEEEQDTPISEFLARLESIEQDRYWALVEQREDRLEAIDDARQTAANAATATPESTMEASVARQMDARFYVLPEPGEKEAVQPDAPDDGLADQQAAPMAPQQQAAPPAMQQTPPPQQ